MGVAVNLVTVSSAIFRLVSFAAIIQCKTGIHVRRVRGCPTLRFLKGGIRRLRTARDFTTISNRDKQTGSVPRRLKPRFFPGLGCGAWVRPSGTRVLPGQNQGQGQKRRAGVPLHAIRNPHFSQRTREMGHPAGRSLRGFGSTRDLSYQSARSEWREEYGPLVLCQLELGMQWRS
jgi:hypothetical protein